MSSIDNAKKVAGWKHPNERACCMNCRNGVQETAGAGFCPPSWRCSLGGFFTHRHAVCDNWTDIVGVRS